MLQPADPGRLRRLSMLALAYVDDRLFEAGIEGGPVAWLHDEIVLEVREDHAEQSAEILKQAMIDAFAETFPGAPLNGLVDPHIGMNWGEAKAGPPAVDLAQVYSEQLRLIEPDAGPEEGRCRAYDHAVSVAVQHDIGLEEAKQMVLNARRTRK